MARPQSAAVQAEIDRWLADPVMNELYRNAALDIILNGLDRFAPPTIAKLSDDDRHRFIEAQVEKFCPALQRWACYWFAYEGLLPEDVLEPSRIVE